MTQVATKKKEGAKREIFKENKGKIKARKSQQARNTVTVTECKSALRMKKIHGNIPIGMVKYTSNILWETCVRLI